MYGLAEPVSRVPKVQMCGQQRGVQRWQQLSLSSCSNEPLAQSGRKLISQVENPLDPGGWRHTNNPRCGKDKAHCPTSSGIEGSWALGKIPERQLTSKEVHADALGVPCAWRVAHSGHWTFCYSLLRLTGLESLGLCCHLSDPMDSSSTLQSEIIKS